MNQQEVRFIFDWRKSQWNYRLPVLIAISLFGHIFCFYIFRVVYPTTTNLLPPSAQVNVLDPDNPQDKSLLDWVEMNNPANVSAPGFDPRLIAQLTPQYKPVYSSLSVDLKPSDSSGPREKGIPSIFSPRPCCRCGRDQWTLFRRELFPADWISRRPCNHASRNLCPNCRRLQRSQSRPHSLSVSTLPDKSISFFYGNRAEAANSISKRRISFGQ